MKTSKSIMIVLAMLIASTASADWFPGMPAKWVQLPDLAPTGIDINATTPVGLADDFLCTTTEPITDIHIWGSWLNDVLPSDAAGVVDPGAIDFRLTIWSDIPADPATGAHSRPGDLLWTGGFGPGDFIWNLYADNIVEGFYDPPSEVYTPDGDHQAYQYNFYIDPTQAFEQKGTTADPKVYWLGVEAAPHGGLPGGPQPVFGWKTSVDHWNDDAVWRNSVPVGPWNELIYPPNHPYYPESIDLAFVITPEPASLGLLVLGSMAMLRRRRS